MKYIYIIFSFFVIAAIAFGCYTGMALAAIQSEGAIPQTGDLCGGTGGNGQIVSVGHNEFTIKRNDDGRNQLIHLASDATIKTSNGHISLSGLKTGERVTLVGGPNPDGSFTVDIVVLCSGTQKNVTVQEVQLRQKQTKNFKKVNTWSSYINISALCLVGLIWIGMIIFLRLKQKKSFVYLLFFSVFYVYIIKVLDYTLFQLQSLILLKQFTSGLMLNGIKPGESLNLIPLIMLRLEDVRTSLLNILLMMPFGFGLPFITNWRLKKVVLLGTFFSIGIEFLQFITGRIAGITFRIADINDVIFNTLGVTIGYMLFIGFIRTYRRIFHNWKILGNPILRYIAKRPQVDTP